METSKKSVTHADGQDGHNFLCPLCGQWVSPYGCITLLARKKTETRRLVKTGRNKT